MKKLHVNHEGAWLPVFSHTGGRIVTCEKHPEKALPTMAVWASDDLDFFVKKFANKEFELRHVDRNRNTAVSDSPMPFPTTTIV
jgi:hypothetical protein